ncbi:MAG: hypothetical protein Q9227_009517 [Pyrenula ochraceoflavens]
MFNLVFCGVTDPNNEANGSIFANFMGITMTLKSVSGEIVDAYSCFDIYPYLRRCGSVRWGYDGEERIHTYTRDQYETGTMFFEQIGPADLLDKVKTSIRALHSKTKAGDIVNVFFQARGTPEGEIRIGDNILERTEVATLLCGFEEGVQVNMVGSHCYTGQLADIFKVGGTSHRDTAATASTYERSAITRRAPSNRLRHSRFSHPLIQSPARIKLPHVEQIESGPITAESHENFLVEALKLSFGIEQDPTSISLLSSEKDAALELLEDLVFRDMADVLYEPQTMHRRRRVEWPFINLTGLNRLIMNPLHPRSEVINQMRKLVLDAWRTCGCWPAMGDDLIYQEMRKLQPDYLMLFKNLYWRGRQQSAMFDLWWMLYERRFLKLECLNYPFNCYVSGCNVAPVAEVFAEFSGVRQFITSFKPFEDYEATSQPVNWLSAMIARACSTDADKIFETIQFTGILGEFDEKSLSYLASIRRGVTYRWECRLDEVSESDQSLNGEFFGCWLPSGLGPNVRTYPKKIAKRMERFNCVEGVYKALFNIDDEDLVLEHEQDTYLRRNPMKRPWYKTPGSWRPNPLCTSFHADDVCGCSGQSTQESIISSVSTLFQEAE